MAWISGKRGISMELTINDIKKRNDVYWKILNFFEKNQIIEQDDCYAF